MVATVGAVPMLGPYEPCEAHLVHSEPRVAPVVSVRASDVAYYTIHAFEYGVSGHLLQTERADCVNMRSLGLKHVISLISGTSFALIHFLLMMNMILYIILHQ